MNTKAFIKVTPKGGGKSVVMPEGNRSFYLSQGAEITTPTPEEVLQAFPELAKAEKKRESEKNAKVITRERVDTITELRNERDALKHENQILRDENSRLKSEIKSLKAATTPAPESPVDEPEKVVEPEAPAKPATKSRGGRRSRK